jgi:pimeloyl-ACP methyl ester carboxylesterase
MIQGYSPNLRDYGFLAHANAIAALARQLNISQLVLGGHDWGGATVYRVAQWYPSLISAVFAVATPYNATSKTFTSTEALAKGKLPNFGYQLQLGSEDGVMEGVIGGDRAKVEKFLNGMYGGRTSSRRKFMVPEKGVDLDVLENDQVGKTPFFEERVSAY